MLGSLAARRQAVVRGWVVLAIVAALAISLLVGLVYAISLATGGSSDHASRAPGTSTTTAGETPSSTPTSPTALRRAEDALAAKPMLQLPPSAAQPQPLVSATPGPAIRLPRAKVSSELVSTGFPRMPEGAVAQLAAIDSLAWLNANPDQVREVYAWAATPGAVALSDWTPYVGIVNLLDQAGVPSGSTALHTSFTPTHALIKGVLDGGNFVVACVLGEFDGNYRSETKAGVGDCQRMVWSAGRWRIGPGAQPSYAPSAWPGSADCVRAGWRAIADA